ncbi:MAG: PspC domain-containing protein, partial [Nitriliruptoraceae bacterium]|nr:PspC domain-containing protein [Nitriliruptoraceae bacterium]
PPRAGPPPPPTAAAPRPGPGSRRGGAGTGTAPGPTVAPRSWRELRRPTDARVVAGVAIGLARYLGVDVVIVRIAFGVLAFAGGVGVLLYGALWALVPRADGPVAPTRPATIQQAVALGMITLGVLGLLRAVGLWFGDALVVPIVLAAAGSAVVWTRGDGTTRAAWTRLGARLPTRAMASAGSAPVSPVRVVVGTLLVAGAIAGFLAANDALVAVRDLGLAVVAALIGIGLLFGPWLWRVRGELLAERAQRVRQEERADMAAHLHDSVLQTLALIQRADEPARMVTLARRQERELRAWLYGQGRATDAWTTLGDGFAALVEEVEATYDVVVELVTVGDAPLDEAGNALLGATREAVVNAAKHARTPTVDVYLEVEEERISSFVRDRGVGFDAGRIPDDRQGIRRSMRDRIARVDGQVTLHTAPGDGTEVELEVPRRSGRAHDRHHDSEQGAP